MFFRHSKPKVLTFSDRLGQARDAGFHVEQAGGETRVSRKGCAAAVSESGEDSVAISNAGVLVGKEIAVLVDLGYQKVWQTPAGTRIAARADQLKAVHAFVEDLREVMGLTSLYNEGLGSTNELHLYDRVEGRDGH